MGDLVSLAERLRQAEQVTKGEWRRLSDPTGGPFGVARRAAGSGEAWRGPAAEHCCELLITLQSRYLDPLVDELGRLGARLAKVADEVEYAIRLEANGAAFPIGMDLDGSLARLQRCEVLASPPPGWCDGLGGTPGGYVSIDPRRTRDLAGLVRGGGNELRSSFDRLRAPLREVGLEPFPELRHIAAAAGDLADTVVKRVEAYEEADRRAAGCSGLLPLGFAGQALATMPPPAPVPPQGAGPRRSVKQWQAQALRRAGIDPKKWRPEKRLAANRGVIPKVYDYYGEMYRSHPGQFWWMGMGNLVGPQFYAAFTDLCIAAHTTGGDVPFSDMVNIPATDLKFFEKAFLQMQQKIFLDLAWQHEAFLAGGVEEIDRLADAGAFGKRPQAAAMKKAWRDIASGVPELVARGNKALIYREQHDVIQKDYNKIRRHDWPVGQGFTWFLSRQAGDASPIPGNKPFRDTVAVDTLPDLNPDWVPERLIPGKDGDVSSFNDRWKWIDKDMLPAYERFLKEHPDEMQETVAIPLEDRAKRFRRLPGKCG